MDLCCFWVYKCVLHLHPLLFLSTPLPPDPLSMDSLQSLSSDSATLAMQQAMLGADDSMDGTEEEDEEEEEEEEEEGMEEEEEEDGEEENDRGRQMSGGGGGRRDLSMEHREELE